MLRADESPACVETIQLARSWTENIVNTTETMRHASKQPALLLEK